MSAPAASTPDQRIGRDAPAPVSDAEATRLFSRSVVISGVRCTLAYVVFPWILPLIGVTATVGPWLGIVIGVVAIGFNIASIRRFWISRHRWRWGITALNLSVIALLTVLLVDDLIDVFK
ncbi:MAG: hypothetical protein V9E99_05470 [Microthrixaceae bacterium]|nr:hypothetical protein [Microthrixaceae bacterium]HMT24548.1 hypothetical protein [Microthrixaceae bacterium]